MSVQAEANCLAPAKAAERRRVALAALVTAALYTAGFIWAFGNLAHWPGSASYERLAQNLLQGKGYSLDGIYPTALRPPLYPLILALTMRLAGAHWFAATVGLQAVAAALCLIMVFALARRCWPQGRAPIYAAGLLSLHGPFMFEMLSLRETVWFTLALLAAASLLVRASRSAASSAGLGLSLACLYLLRPTGLMIIGGTAAFWAWNIYSRKEGAGKTLAGAAVVVLVVVLPWQVFTYRNFGAPGFFPSSSNGFNLAKGLDPAVAEVSPWVDPDLLDAGLLQLVWTVPWQDERTKDQAWKQIAYARARAAPQRLILRAVANAAEFASPLPMPLGTGRIQSTPRGLTIENFRFNWTEIAFAPLVLFLLIAGVAGLKALWRSEGAGSTFGRWTAVVSLTLLAVHAVTFAKTRYRLPLDALLAVAAGGWLAGIKRRPRRPAPGDSPPHEANFPP